MSYAVQYGGSVSEAATKTLKPEPRFRATFERIFAESENKTQGDSGQSFRLFHRPAQGLYAAHGGDALRLAREFFGSDRVVSYWEAESSSSAKSKSSTAGANKRSAGNSLGLARGAKAARLGVAQAQGPGSLGAGAGHGSELAREGGEEEAKGLAYLSVREGREVSDVLSFLLFQKKVRVEIYLEVAGGASSRGGARGTGGSSGGGWALSRVATPGNYEGVEDLLGLDDFAQEAPVAMAVWLNSASTTGSASATTVGAAFVDNVAMTLQLCELADTEQLSALESLLVQADPKEVLIPSHPQDQAKRLRDALDRCNVPCTEVKRKNFGRAANLVVEDCQKLCNNAEALQSAVIAGMPAALGACSAVIQFLQLLGTDDNFQHYKVTVYSLAGHMRLDAAAVEALHVLPSASGSAGPATHTKLPAANPVADYAPSQVSQSGSTDGQSTAAKTNATSIFALLNHCKTFMGKRLLVQWLRQPLISLEEINQRQSMVAFFTEPERTQVRSSLFQKLRRSVPDVDKQLKKLGRLAKPEQFRGGAGIREVYHLHRFATALTPIVADLDAAVVSRAEADVEVAEHFVAELRKLAEDLAAFQQMAESVIDFEAADNDDYIVLSSFDEALEELADYKSRLYSEFEEHVEAVMDSLNVRGKFNPKTRTHTSKLTTDFNKRIGLFLRLPKSEKKTLDESVYRPLRGAGFVDTDVNKGKVWKFTTDKIDSINEKWLSVVENYEKRSSEIVQILAQVALEYSGVLSDASSRIAELDCIMSLAEASVTHGYKRPKMLPAANDPAWKMLPGGGRPDAPQPVIRVIAARHPCLDAQDDCDFVPNDIILEHDQSRFVMITGPNMGGKSTYIRTVGVCSLMAQIGCFVPCESAEMCVVDGIFCRVGASDSQLRGVSTFMAEMLEMSGVLQSASSSSLLIVDELGRGTSTYDGFGLAWAIAEHVCNTLGCWALFATHFHELTQLEESIPFASNLHVDAVIEGEQLVLLHQIRRGPSLQSFGIRVAELANFPAEVVASARQKLEDLEHASSTAGSGTGAAPTVSLEVRRDNATAARAVQRFLEHLREAVQARGGDAASLDDETIINIVRDGRQAIGPENVQLAVQMLKKQLV